MTRTSRHGPCVLARNFCVDSKQSKFLPSFDEGIFVVRPGFTYTHERLVLPPKIRNNDITPLRVKQFEFSLLDETFVFPARKVIADDLPKPVRNRNMSSCNQPGQEVNEATLRLAEHDPDRMPDGSADSSGYKWDGFRLARSRKSSRPPGIPSDMCGWHLQENVPAC